MHIIYYIPPSRDNTNTPHYTIITPIYCAREKKIYNHYGRRKKSIGRTGLGLFVQLYKKHRICVWLWYIYNNERFRPLQLIRGGQNNIYYNITPNGKMRIKPPRRREK